MAAYLIADIDVRDPVAFEEYRKQVAPLVAKFGGKYLVRGGAFEKVEGDWNPKRWVVLEFESVERVNEFYCSEEYKPVRDLRIKASSSNVVIVEGV